MSSVNGPNTFYCSFVSIHYIICECGDTFPTEDALKEHLENDHNPNIIKNEYICETCDKVFASEKACVIHQRVHTNPRVKIDSDDSTDVQQSRKKYSNAKNIVCEVCGKRYASNAALRYHQRVHTGERPYLCPLCPKTFTMPLFLQIHVRTHTGEKPYQCQVCPKAFGNRAALLRHDRVHTGVKPYPCPKCGKSFTQSNSMKLHVKTVHLKWPAPYKSKSRRLKEAQRKGEMNVEIEIENAMIDSKVSEVVDVVEVKHEEEQVEEYVYDENTIYEEVEAEEGYEQIKVEGDEVLLYEQVEDSDVVYEEVDEFEMEEVKFVDYCVEP